MVLDLYPEPSGGESPSLNFGDVLAGGPIEVSISPEKGWSSVLQICLDFGNVAISLLCIHS